ncbi:MAG: hypothetical protein AAF696_10490 [Bacteroidota bacterium]
MNTSLKLYHRIWMLSKLEFIEQKRLIINLVSIFFLLSLIAIGIDFISPGYYNSSGNSEALARQAKFHFYWFPISFSLCSIFLSSLICQGLSQNTKRKFYLILPANTSEKWFSKWLIISVFFPLILIVAYQIFAFLSYELADCIGVPLVKLSFTDPYFLKWVVANSVLQSFFFLGSLAFPKFTFFKTGLILMGTVFGIFVLFLLISFSSFEIDSFINPYSLLHTFTQLIKSENFIFFWFFLIGTVGLSMLAGFFKLKETQL